MGTTQDPSVQGVEPNAAEPGVATPTAAGSGTCACPSGRAATRKRERATYCRAVQGARDSGVGQPGLRPEAERALRLVRS